MSNRKDGENKIQTQTDRKLNKSKGAHQLNIHKGT